MKNLVVVAVCTVSLSGCSLPVGVSTWSEDGWSVLATQKSILDHGISYVSGEDCALWRMFTEHDVCQQDDAEAVLADADTDQQYPAGYADDALADLWVSPASKLPCFFSISRSWGKVDSKLSLAPFPP